MVEIKYKFSIDFVFNLFSLLKYCSTIQLVFFLSFILLFVLKRITDITWK